MSEHRHISIHAPLTGSDPKQRPAPFQLGISIHAPLTGSDPPGYAPKMRLCISIHAPLTGSDPRTRTTSSRGSDFNPRSPYGERRRTSHSSNDDLAFQSTLPLRGATLQTNRKIPINIDFNPRSPYGERLGGQVISVGADIISIHAPLTGSDFSCIFTPPSMREFQSTLPLRGATMTDMPLSI